MCNMQELTSSRKKRIRKFVFLGLPGEIRNMIYSLVLTPQNLVTTGPPPEPYSASWCESFGVIGQERIVFGSFGSGMTLEPIGAYGHGHVETQIMRLCSTIHHEAITLFFSTHHVQLYLGLDFGTRRPVFPAGFSSSFVTDLRILFVNHESWPSTTVASGVDLHPILGDLPALSSLRVAIRFYLLLERKMKNSAIVTGLVMQIIDATPKHVKLIWETWAGPHDMACVYSYHGKLMRQPSGYPVDIDNLGDIASKWKRSA
jgi:hypothetical protein